MKMKKTLLQTLKTGSPKAILLKKSNLFKHQLDTLKLYYEPQILHMRQKLSPLGDLRDHSFGTQNEKLSKKGP